MNNRDRLIDLIVDNKLERREVAELLGVSREQVDRWLFPREHPESEEVPTMAVELLELKLRLGMRQEAAQGKG
ncbi:MAG: hypothetical protein D6786_05755 [Gammaproteobacteria bacterium]|nr:MAG: hypothetical protein D6786_05755 [Gammaproteobacteria bacterium]